MIFVIQDKKLSSEQNNNEKGNAWCDEKSRDLGVAKMCAVLKMALFNVFQIFLCQRSTLAQQT